MQSVYRELGLSRQAVHQQWSRDDRQTMQYEQIIPIVREWRIKHPRMGSRALYYSIKNVGGIDLGLGVNRFEQLMSTSGLTIKPGRTRIVKTSDGKGKGDYPNLINGLILDNVNQLIAGDITYYNIDGQCSYIFTLKDIYSQRVLGLIPSLTMEASIAIQCLEQVFMLRKDINLQGCIHHSDNGSQYNSTAYKKMLTDAGMLISRAENCLENGSAENLNSIVKNMYLKPWSIRTFKELEQACQELIYINNHQRAIEQLGQLSPVQFEQLVAKLHPEERPKKVLYDFDS
ncbi:MAG: DDE-type integrase/transposase/recombinase [Saprospiraceae bacterium]|jgi:putative transposase|nr:DDE-type integrase/transposase/recombinase [Saprospiraceae bacterium]